MKNIVLMPVQDVHPYPNNPRINRDAVDKVAASLKEFGFRQPIVVDKDHVIIAGHTRLEAAKQLGMSEVPVLVADDLSAEQVKAYRLADNKTADYSIWDNKKLLEELDALDDFDIFTGFELGSLFDETLDELDNTAVDENEKGVVYEVIFKSEDKDLIDKITKAWEKMSHEE